MWSPDSWREKSALQQPDYADPAELERVLADLHALPPLVTSWEILRLRDQLAEAAEGRQFVLQAGADSGPHPSLSQWRDGAGV